MTEQRTARRIKVFLVAEVAGGDPDAGRRAHVLDISPEGARLHARTMSRAGDPLDLTVAGRRQTASVIWVRHPIFGVRFAAPLSPERLETIVSGPGQGDCTPR